MDYRNKESIVVEKNADEQIENSFFALADVQLALVGGGCGEIIVG